MGTPKARKKLAKKIQGVSAATAKEVLRCSATDTPTLYLIRIGYVNDFKKILKIKGNYSDNAILYKFGRSKTLEGRIGDHDASYGSLPGSDLSLVYYHIIDNEYLPQAEADLHKYMKNLKYKVIAEGHSELIACDETEIKVVKEEILKIGTRYCHTFSDVMKLLKEKDNEITHLTLRKKLDISSKNHKIEILQKEVKHMKEARENDLESKQTETDLLKEAYQKELEHLRMALEKEKEVHQKDLKIMQYECENKIRTIKKQRK